MKVLQEMQKKGKKPRMQKSRKCIYCTDEINAKIAKNAKVADNAKSLNCTKRKDSHEWRKMQKR